MEMTPKKGKTQTGNQIGRAHDVIWNRDRLWKLTHGKKWRDIRWSILN